MTLKIQHMMYNNVSNTNYNDAEHYCACCEWDGPCTDDFMQRHEAFVRSCRYSMVHLARMRVVVSVMPFDYCCRYIRQYSCALWQLLSTWVSRYGPWRRPDLVRVNIVCSLGHPWLCMQHLCPSLSLHSLIHFSPYLHCILLMYQWCFLCSLVSVMHVVVLLHLLAWPLSICTCACMLLIFPLVIM